MAEAGRVVGRISIKVMPDTTDFRDDLRKKLRKIQKSTELSVRVKLDTNSTKHVKREIKDWAKDADTKVDIGLDLNGAALRVAQARLAVLARSRIARIVPLVDKSAAVKAAGALGTLVAAASGGRVVHSFAKNMIDAFKDIDKLVPKIGAVGLGILNLTSAALASSSNLFALSSSLASIGALAVTLPATLAAAAIGVGVLVAAFKDFNTVMPEVKKALSSMQDSISAKFWDAALVPMRAMIDNLLPQFAAGFDSAAAAFGRFFGDLSTALNGKLDGAIAGMFTQLTSSIDIARGAAAPLAGIIATLGQVGAAYLPRMAEWFVKISDTFNQWLESVASNGQLDQWINNGLTALSDLGRVISNVFGILSGVADAAKAAGGSSLGMFADTLEKIHAVVDSPAFQTGLIAAFTGAHKAMEAIGSAAGPQLVTFFSSLGSALGTLLPIAGGALGTALGAVAEGLTAMLASGGVTALFEGIAVAIEALAPAMGPIGSLLGTLAGSMGNFAGLLGPLFAAILPPLIQGFQLLMPAIDALVNGLMPPLIRIFQLIAPLIVQVGAIIGSILVQAMDALGPVIDMVVELIGMLVPMIGDLLAAVMPLIGPLLKLVVAVLKPLIKVIMEILKAALPPLIAAFEVLVGAILPVLDILIQVVTWIMGMLAPVLIWLGELLVGAITGIIQGITGVFSGFQAIWDGFVQMFSGGWSNFFSGLVSIVFGIFSMILGILKVLWNLGVVKLFSVGFALIKGIFTGAAKWLITTVKSIGTNIATAFKYLWARLVQGLKNWWTSFKAEWVGVGRELKSGATAMWNGIKTAFSTGLSRAIGFVKKVPGQIKAIFGSAVGILANAGRDVIQGFIDGLTGMFGNVKDTLQGLTKKLTSWKGPAPVDRKLLTPAGVMVMQSFLKGLESEYDTIRRSLNGFTAEIGSTEVNSPRIAPVSGSVSAALNAAIDDGSGAPGTTNVDITLNGSDVSAEDVADEFLFATRRIASGGVYARKVNP